jgi:hypothetical protein
MRLHGDDDGVWISQGFGRARRRPTAWRVIAGPFRFACDSTNWALVRPDLMLVHSAGRLGLFTRDPPPKRGPSAKEETADRPPASKDDPGGAVGPEAEEKTP